MDTFPLLKSKCLWAKSTWEGLSFYHNLHILVVLQNAQFWYVSPVVFFQRFWKSTAHKHIQCLLFPDVSPYCVDLDVLLRCLVCLVKTKYTFVLGSRSSVLWNGLVKFSGNRWLLGQPKRSNEFLHYRPRSSRRYLQNQIVDLPYVLISCAF